MRKRREPPAPPSTEELRAINPNSRRLRERGRRYLRPLRHQLLLPGALELPDFELRLQRLIELLGVFGSDSSMDDIARRLGRGAARDTFQQMHLRALTRQGRPDEALAQARAYAAAPDATASAGMRLAFQAMIAGEPDEGIALFRGLLHTPELPPQMRQTILRVLVEAGERAALDAAAIEGMEPIPRAFSVPEGPANLPIHIISLDRDIRRLRVTLPFVRPAGDVTVSSAVPGDAVPALLTRQIVRRGSGPGRMTPGEIGCALSHIRVWERVASEMAPDEYALVLEDDARFIHGPGVGLAETVAAAAAVRAELVFVNERACRDARGTGTDLRIVPIDDPAMRERDREGPVRPGWGTDGYLVSGSGAQRLLDAFAEVGLLGAVDWQMQLMSHHALEPWQRKPATRRIFLGLSGRESWPVLPGFVSSIPIIRERDFGASVINAS